MWATDDFWAERRGYIDTPFEVQGLERRRNLAWEHELSRVTGKRAYLELAGTFVDRRGHGWLQPPSFGAAYFQDRVPVRRQTQIEGHAVRALYLNCAATDLSIETGERALLDAMLAQWEDMVTAKLYVTGGLGADASRESETGPVRAIRTSRPATRARCRCACSCLRARAGGA